MCEESFFCRTSPTCCSDLIHIPRKVLKDILNIYRVMEQTKMHIYLTTKVT